MKDTVIEELRLLVGNDRTDHLAPWQIENGKAEFLDFLYKLYRRDEAEIGLRCTYTGLWQQFCKDLGTLYRDGYIAGIHFNPDSSDQ